LQRTNFEKKINFFNKKKSAKFFPADIVLDPNNPEAAAKALLEGDTGLSEEQEKALFEAKKKSVI
jgi:hypothetical protein